MAEYSSFPTLERQRAQLRHVRMRGENASNVALGRFYASLLNSNVWDSQAELSVALGVSKAQVSKLLKADRLADEVINTFGDDRRISIRTIELLERLSARIGSDILRKHAVMLGMRHDLSVPEVFAALATGCATRLPRHTIRLTAHRGENHIRLYSPCIRQLKKDLLSLEVSIQLALTLIKP